MTTLTSAPMTTLTFTPPNPQAFIHVTENRVYCLHEVENTGTFELWHSTRTPPSKKYDPRCVARELPRQRILRVLHRAVRHAHNIESACEAEIAARAHRISTMNDLENV